MERVKTKKSLVLDDVAGIYMSSRRHINVLHDARSRTTVHEFCHALDHEEGWISESGAEVLESYAQALEGDPLYPSESDRTREAFARFCDDGPQALALVEELDAQCGLDTPDSLAALRFVQEAAFPDSADGDSLEGLDSAFDFEIESSWLSGTEAEASYRGAYTVRGEAGLFVYDAPWAADIQEGDEDYIEPSILLMDEESGEVLDQLALEPHGQYEAVDNNPAFRSHLLFGSSADPLLVGLQEEYDGRAWRVRADPLRLEEIDWTDQGETDSVRGFEHEGALMLFDVLTEPLRLVDLQTGTAVIVAEGEESEFNAEQAEAMYADETGIIAVYYAPTGLALVDLTWAGERGWIRDIPIAATHVLSLLRLADGSVIVTPSVYTGLEEDGFMYTPDVTMRYRPSTDSWSVPEGTCLAIGHETWLASGNGAVRIGADQVGEEPETWELTLMRLTVSE